MVYFRNTKKERQEEGKKGGQKEKGQKEERMAKRKKASAQVTGNMHSVKRHAQDAQQLFSTEPQSQFHSRTARCACMTMRHKQPCTSVSQDDNYQTSQECPSNRHHTLDLLHASSMLGETNRRTATRERTQEDRSSSFQCHE